MSVKSKILYIDMDNVLVDFSSGIAQLPRHVMEHFEERLDEVPGIFSLMSPMPGAVESFKELAGLYDTYILSTAPWENPSAWSDKLLWVKRHLGLIGSGVSTFISARPGFQTGRRWLLTLSAEQPDNSRQPTRPP
jgi:5'(3')-deoxyribonucleotidase